MKIVKKKYNSPFPGRAWLEKKSLALKYSRKKRGKRVRLRRKYARSLMHRTLQSTWNVGLFGILAFSGLWLLRSGATFWKTSPFIQLQGVEFKKDVPPELKSFLSLKPGQNIFLINTARLQEAALKTFPELKSVSIRRNWDRTLSVQGEYRTPVVYYYPKPSAARYGIGEDGRVFALKNAANATNDLPTLTGNRSDIDTQLLVEALEALKKSLPDFYSSIKQLKTDRINTIKVVLDGDVVIHWGELSLDSVLSKAKKVQNILDRFLPAKPMASMELVEGDRIVLDAHWIPRDQSERREHLVKTRNHSEP